MPHDVSLIALLAAGFGLALLLGMGATLLKLPPLVGYLLAGVVISPQTPGFVADVGLAGQLAEIGVMLLMFGVGLHFSMDDLLRVRRIAVPGAIVQIAVATAMGAGLSLAWGWSLGAAIVLGLSLSVASTVVLLRTLQARGMLQSVQGQIAVGWLVVEDLVMVAVLVLLPVLAPLMRESPAAAAVEAGAAWLAIALTLAKVSAFVATMMLVGRWVLPRILWWVARTGSQELFTLCVVAVAIGVAFGAAKLFDVSFALGAFFAGMMLRESEFSHRAADETLPLRDAFAVLFFVCVGMLFDPAILWQEPLKLLAVLAIVIVGKTIAAMALVIVFRYPLSTALTVGASLAQIGEFSFILVGLGVVLGLLPEAGRNLVLATAFISIALNAAVFGWMQPLRQWLLTHFAAARAWDRRDDPLASLPEHTDLDLLHDQVVLVGYGHIGQRTDQALRSTGMAVVIVEQDRAVVDALRQQGRAAVCGDAVTAEVLIQAHVMHARVVVITLSDAVEARQIAVLAKSIQPGVGLVMHCDSRELQSRLQHDTGATVVLSQDAVADGLAHQVMNQRDPCPPSVPDPEPQPLA